MWILAKMEEKGLSFIFVADDAFALGEHILKPLKNLSREQAIFNYRLSRARRVVGNACGIMSNRFRIFHTAINLSIHKIDTIVHCCCVLHNYLHRTSASYKPQSNLDREGTVAGNVIIREWRNDMEGLMNIARAQPQRPTQLAR